MQLFYFFVRREKCKSLQTIIIIIIIMERSERFHIVMNHYHKTSSCSSICMIPLKFSFNGVNNTEEMPNNNESFSHFSRWYQLSPIYEKGCSQWNFIWFYYYFILHISRFMFLYLLNNEQYLTTDTFLWQSHSILCETSINDIIFFNHFQHPNHHHIFNGTK